MMLWWSRLRARIGPYVLVLFGAGMLTAAVGLTLLEQGLASGPLVSARVVSIGMQTRGKRPACMVFYRYLADRERYGSDKLSDAWCDSLRPGHAIDVRYDSDDPSVSRPDVRYLLHSPSKLVALFGVGGAFGTLAGGWQLWGRWRGFFAELLRRPPAERPMQARPSSSARSAPRRQRKWRDPCPCGSGRQWRKCCLRSANA